jgi:hypothetical protein
MTTPPNYYELSGLTPKADDAVDWMGADVGGDLPPFDWGPTELPSLRPVRHVPGRGLVIEDAVVV